MFASTLILTTIFAIVSVLAFKRIKYHVKNYILLNKLPGPPPDGLFVGNMPYLQTTPEDIFNRLREANKKFYPIYKLFAVHRMGANILSPEDSEIVLSNPIHNEKGYIYKLLHHWLKEGLLTSKGEKWQLRRKILTPAFHFNILQQFIMILNEEAEKLVEGLRKECHKPYINITPHISQFTLKSITETAMGTKLDFTTKKEIRYKEAVYKIGKILTYRITHPWFIEPLLNIFSPCFIQERRVTSTLHKFTKEVIEDREKNFKDFELPTEEHDVYKGKKRLAMLDLLLSAKKKDGIIDNKGIQEEVDTFMFEGHDTTAVALNFALMLIACHKDVQETILQEMRDVLGDIHAKPTYSDLQNLKYLERCIKESLRLYPSVHLISRALGEDVRTQKGYLIPKDTITIIHIYDLHHNPDIYPDPEKFDPDRFLPENCQNRHPFAYLPFSAGPRNCIGQRFAMLELKAAICAILANFVLEPIDTPETIVVVVDIVLRTKEGIKIRFVPREQ
ncbi:cytochrome P450 monooxigenase CYP4Q2 [Tribolium castaneum]|uniref:Cytochrome P450-like protein n=1 Tax=Tribolium castaneum TaxID=7070 RepID=D6X2S9_TRICA|nr:cytochrome P450 monooxigenase CYP4Q2 [Tribolium castaneum]EFA10753.1 cytochrome P450-like protein [Tribolium castaneum]|eukprot:NP_001107846.1 cytochrome P450 monooxigenase CYP4Q2 [Tribolium castaneum]